MNSFDVMDIIESSSGFEVLLFLTLQSVVVGEKIGKRKGIEWGKG